MASNVNSTSFPTVSGPPTRTPLIDTNTGIINSDWLKYLNDLHNGTALGNAFANVTVVQSFTGSQSAQLLVEVDASTLTGTTLASNVVNSSLTSVGTLVAGATGIGFTVNLASSTLTGTLPWANLPAGVGQWVAQPTIIGQLTVNGGISVLTDITPLHGFQSNLGSPTSKFLAIWAAELFVETLVAQSVMATIGGRIVVAPTTTLSADMAPTDTTITVKYNNLNTGDILLMEGRGQIEWLQVTGVVGGTQYAWTYPVTRNYGGASSAQQWYVGDALLDTGTTGNGYIDLYSISGVFGSTNGPTIVGNVRTGTAYNAVDPRWAIGNLHGVYNYTVDTYGAAFGVASATYVTIDATNGLRILNNGTLKLQADTSGNLTLTGTLSVGTSGNIHSGQTAYNTGTGYWLEYNSGTPRVSVGVAGGNGIVWDGANLTVVSANLTINSSGITLAPATSMSAGSAYNFGFTSGATGAMYGVQIGGLGAQASITIDVTNASSVANEVIISAHDTRTSQFGAQCQVFTQSGTATAILEASALGTSTATLVAQMTSGGTGSIVLTATTIGLTGVVTCSSSLAQYGRAFGDGAWQNVAYSAGNFGSSSGTWTVSAGNQSVYRYAVVGKIMFLEVILATTSVAGTPTDLTIAVPGGFTVGGPGGAFYDATFSYLNNLVAGAGVARAASGAGTVVLFTSLLGAAWSNATSQTYISLQMCFEVQ